MAVTLQLIPDGGGGELTCFCRKSQWESPGRLPGSGAQTSHSCAQFHVCLGSACSHPLPAFLLDDQSSGIFLDELLCLLLNLDHVSNVLTDNRVCR